VGDLWINMYKSVNIPYGEEMTVTYTQIHNLIPWLRLKITFLSIYVSLRSRQKYFFRPLEESIILQNQGLTLDLGEKLNGVESRCIATTHHDATTR